METLIVFPEKKKDLQAVKAVLKALNIRFEEKDTYNPKFVEKIEESRLEIAKGEGVKIDLKDLWK